MWLFYWLTNSGSRTAKVFCEKPGHHKFLGSEIFYVYSAPKPELLAKKSKAAEVLSEAPKPNSKAAGHLRVLSTGCRQGRRTAELQG